MKNVKITICFMIACMMAVVNVVSAELVQGINIDFVNIGNAGNAEDTTGFGMVGDNYRIGKYEISNAQWNAFIAVAGTPMGNPSEAYETSTTPYTGISQPVTDVSPYEALQFCNYLTSGDKSKGAYQFSGNNVNPGSYLGIDRASAEAAYGTIYVLPTADEWYKAAYYKPDGNGYSLYANGMNTIPSADHGWNYSGGAYNAPWDIGTGTMEQNGTYDMMGNVWEWNETLIDGYSCGMLGGSFYQDNYFGVGYGVNTMSSSCYLNFPAYFEGTAVGFRVASVPEPCSLVLLSLGGLISRRRRKS